MVPNGLTSGTLETSASFFFFCNSMETIRMVADLVRLWVIPLRTWEGDLIFNLSYFLLEDLVVSSRGVWGWGLDFDEFRI